MITDRHEKPMTIFLLRIGLAVMVYNLSGSASADNSSGTATGQRLTLNFNSDWKFIKSDPAGAATPDFDDREWTTVSSPHTYNDIDTFDDWSILGHVGEQNQWSGRTWYRKTFTLPDSFKDKKIYIEFEAVRQVAEVYLNGKLLGTSKTGFVPFGFDLTPQLRFGSPNVLAVMCDNRFMKDPIGTSTGKQTANPTGTKDAGPGGGLAALSAQVNATIPEDITEIQADQIPWNNPHWHPAHGGIFRNVYLHVTDPLHISLPLYSFLQTAGPYVYATDISDKSARVNVEIPVENGRKTDEKIDVQVEIFDHDGKSIAVLKQNGQIASGAHSESKLSIVIENPRLWEPDYPYLYRIAITLKANDNIIDTTDIPFGIRMVGWDAQSGFYINGHHLKLHGWGQKPTDEWPGLGAAQPDWMHFYTLNLMKQAGGNFVRWGHCAGGPASIASGDRLGIIADQPGVEGESDTQGAAWKIRVAAFRDTIIYYRNHPSILIWEGGNQKVSRDHAQELRGYMDKYDPYGGRVYAHRRSDKITAEFMDVCIGTEGGREVASLPVVEGEYDREESPRRVWDDFSPPNFGYPEAKGQTYQLDSEQYAVNEVIQYVQKFGAADHCGGANWIFSDSTSGGRVACEVARTSGEVDGVRLQKEAWYVCQVMFCNDPQVHIIGHWTYPAGTKKNVYVVSNSEDVELFVNGRSLGHGKVSNRYLFTFPDVTWEAGQIKAVAYIGGKSVATLVQHTAGSPVALRLTSITGPGGLRADGADVALIDVEAVDAEGQRCPTFQKCVDFEIEGPGVWRGGYNSGKIKSINNLYLDLECGINRVSVRVTRTPGDIIVRAKCEGLKPGSLTIRSVEAKVANGFTPQMPAIPAVTLPKEPPAGQIAAAAQTPASDQKEAMALAGRFTKAFTYSGPSSSIVRLEADVQQGKNAYIDVDSPFAPLPAELVGADWVKAANRDSLYSAVDLMEISVKAGTVVSVAHDDRLPRPAWLTRQFKPTDLSLVIGSSPMKVFQRRAEQDESLTLGANTEDTSVTAANMYIVFMNAVTYAAPHRGTSQGVPDAHLNYTPGKAPKFWSIAAAETVMARYPDYREAYWKRWSYVQGYMFYGFEMLYRSTGDKKYLDFIQRYIDEFVDEKGNFHGDNLNNLDNLMTGSSIVAMYEYTKDSRYKIAATQFRQALDDYPRSTDGQFWHGKGSANMWVDGIFMGQMFVIRYGKSIGDSQYCWDEATRQITVFAKHCLKGDSGLYLHAWTENLQKAKWADPNTGLSPEVWSEGLGWYALIIPETLAVLPKDHPKRPEVEDIFRRLAAGLKRTQDPKTGGWFLIVDKGDQTDNWIDPSGTAMFVYSIQRGIELNLLDKMEYAPVVTKGYKGLLEFAKVNEQGLVDIHGAGDGITIKKDYATYVSVKKVLNAKEAVAGFLWASAIVEKPELEKLKKP